MVGVALYDEASGLRGVVEDMLTPSRGVILLVWISSLRLEELV